MASKELVWLSCAWACSILLFAPPCIALTLASHTYTFVIDHVTQGRVEPPEPAPVEGADYEQDQGKPECI
jgi:hypothetical protein